MNLSAHKTEIVCTLGVQSVCEEDHPADWEAYVRSWLTGHDLAGDLAIVTQGPSNEFPDMPHRMEVTERRGPQ
jgi:hypothetical protein